MSYQRRRQLCLSWLLGWTPDRTGSINSTRAVALIWPTGRISKSSSQRAVVPEGMTTANATENQQPNLPPMPLVGLGTFLIPVDQVDAALSSAVRMGYRRIDCAPVYFNEHAVGDVLHRLVVDEGVVQRTDLFVTSKLASPFHRREHVRPALEKTLRDLRLRYLDLFLIHWPVAFRHVPIPSDPAIRGWEDEAVGDSDGGNNIDPHVSIHETWQAMEECVDAGLVRRIGVSNFPVALLNELMSNCRIPPAVNQCESHPYLPQHRLLEYCRQRGVDFQAYSPLGSRGYAGTLDTPEPDVLADPTIVSVAKDRGVSPSHVCLAWAIQRNTSVVVKSSHPQHQLDNLNSHQQLQLTPDEMRRLDSLPSRHRFFRPEDWWGSAGAVFD